MSIHISIHSLMNIAIRTISRLKYGPGTAEMDFNSDTMGSHTMVSHIQRKLNIVHQNLALYGKV